MSNTVTTLDKKAIRKEILVLIVPIILEGIFGYLAGIVSSALVGRLSALAISSQGVVFRITDLFKAFIRMFFRFRILRYGIVGAIPHFLSKE